MAKFYVNGTLPIPRTVREKVGINLNDSVHIEANDKNEIVIKKIDVVVHTCIFCEKRTDLVTYRNARICKRCITKLQDKLPEKERK